MDILSARAHARENEMLTFFGGVQEPSFTSANIMSLKAL